MSIRFHDDVYLGGAHGSQSTTAANFGGKDWGKLDLRVLFESKNEVIDHISNFSQMELKKTYLSYGPDFDFLSYPTERDELWELYSIWNFNDDGLHFILNPYAVLAYAFGANTISIPWEFFQPHLAPFFRDSPFGKLIEKNVGKWRS